MFVLSRDVSAAKRVIATLLATALVLWASGAFNSARAANITDVSDLLTDSAPGAVSDHTVDFITPTGIANGDTVVVTFPATFDLTGVTPADVSIEIDTVNDDADWTPVVGVSTITLTQDTNTVAADGQVTVLIGEVSTAGAGANQITNPSSPAAGNESYEIDISAGTSDSGHTRVVILDTVEVTATVDTIFNFAVHQNDVGEAVGSDTTNATSSTTTIPFGTLVADTPVVLSQDLTVQTNAINGFVVTVQSDGPLQSSTGADIDEFQDDDTFPNVPTTWDPPSNGLDVNDENTWGHWGIFSEDNDAGDSMRGADEFADGEWIAASTSAREIFAHDGPADGVTDNIGSTTIGFKVEISALQEAADDYSTTLTYIATPTF